MERVPSGLSKRVEIDELGKEVSGLYDKIWTMWSETGSRTLCLFPVSTEEGVPPEHHHSLCVV